MTRGTFAVLLLVALFAIVAVLTAGGGRDEGQLQFPLVRATPPDPTATFPPRPTPAAPFMPPPGPPFVLPSYATPEPGREGPEATLVEVSTGRSLRLWKAGQINLRIRFSPDSRWLVYDEAPADAWGVHATGAGFQRIDLRQRALQPQRLSDGWAPLFSPNGDLAFLTTRQNSPTGGGYNLHIYRRDGRLFTLRRPAWGPGVWSPDGKWLAFQDVDLAPLGSEPPNVTNLIVNLKTGAVKTVGLSYAQSHGRRPEWSPDSKRVIFGPTRFDDGSYGDGLYEVDTGQTSRLDFRSSWLPDGRIVRFESKPSFTGALFDLYVRRVGEARSSLLAQDVPGSFDATSWSPDGKLVALAVQPSNIDSAQGKRLNAADGSTLDVVEVPGYGASWSADGRFLLTYANTPACNGSHVFRMSDGQRHLCIDRPYFQPEMAAFSPDSGEIAYIHSTSVDGSPIRIPFVEARSNEVRVVDLATNAERTILKDARGYLHCLRWSPDGRWLVIFNFCRDE